jgi:hypothetical protein
MHVRVRGYRFCLALRAQIEALARVRGMLTSVAPLSRRPCEADRQNHVYRARTGWPGFVWARARRLSVGQSEEDDQRSVEADEVVLG